MVKTVFVQSSFVEFGEWIEKRVDDDPWEADETKFKKERSWEKSGNSDCRVDGAKLAIDVDAAVSNLMEENFEVISIAPVTSGHHYSTSGPNVGFGYGFSYTEGVLIVTKRR